MSAPGKLKRAYTNSRFAGEMLVAAELSRLGYQVMLGNIGSHNTKAFDMSAACPITGHAVSISVKALKKRNPFIIDPEHIRPKSVYVFVMTGAAGEPPVFHVIRGAHLLAYEDHFFGKYGRTYKKSHRGIGYKSLEPYISNWAALDRGFRHAKHH
jgi:hypothetical protein